MAQSLAGVDDLMSAPEEPPATGERLSPECLVCHSKLSNAWPDLAAVSQVGLDTYGQYCIEDFVEGAESQCSFCNIIASTYKDACLKYGCSSGEEPTIANLEVHITSTDSGYLIALHRVWMPMQYGLQSPFWGEIIIQLDGPDVYGLGLQPSKSIPQYSNDPKCFETAKEWLLDCRENHQDCKDIADLRKFVPKRLLHIEQIEPRLFLSNSDGPHLEYVALSHCWGLQPFLRTLTHNYAQHQQRIQEDDLPKSFRDAILTSRTLGFKYIWIDSLCIIQDSLQDWEEQSSQMANVYGGAALVLAAAAAPSALDGFLTSRYPYREGKVDVTSKADNRALVSLSYRLIHSVIIELDRDPLNTRAWALQETLTATRYLSYGKWQMSWVCAHSRFRESGTTYQGRLLADPSLNVPRALEWPVTIAPILEVAAVSSKAAALVAWRMYILSPYGDRDLTNSSDRLVALSAVAVQFHARFGGCYLAGLWKEDLLPELLWRGYGKGLPSERPQGPSWSWASVSGRSASRQVLRESQRVGAEVLEAQTTLSTDNLFGGVSSGMLKLSGPVRKAKIIDEKTRGSRWSRDLIRWYVDTPLIRSSQARDGKSDLSARRRSLEECAAVQWRDLNYTLILDQGQVFDSSSWSVSLIVLGHGHYGRLHDENRDRWVKGLVLGQPEEDPGLFQRLGMFMTSPITTQDVNDFLDNCERREVIII